MRSIHATACVVAIATGALCGCVAKPDDSELREKVDALQAENAQLAEELAAYRDERARLQGELAEQMEAAAAANAHEMGQLRGEVKAVRAEFEILRGHAPPPVLVGEELEERLGHKVESVKDAVWESEPSSCVRVLHTIIEMYPNTRAALKAKGVLAEWGMADFELTEKNADEVDERVRTILDGQARVWHELQDATWMAEEGRSREAVAALLKIVDEHPRGTGVHAKNILKEWGVAGIGIDAIDFETIGPRIKKQAAARREVDMAYESLRKGFPEAALESFERVAKEYSGLPQAERARRGIERCRARIAEREQIRKEEKRRAKLRAVEEAHAAELRRKAREAEALERERDKPVKKVGDQIF
jgi:hypothetical protein